MRRCCKTNVSASGALDEHRVLSSLTESFLARKAPRGHVADLKCDYATIGPTRLVPSPARATTQEGTEREDSKSAC